MKRWAALAAVLAVVAVGLVVGVLTRGNGSAAKPSSLSGVVAEVRKSFGDNRLVRATINGSTLHVVTTAGRPTIKSAFEADVLAAAVADWMRANGKTPITAVRYRGSDRLEGDPVPTDAGISTLRPDTCRSVAEASVRSVWETKVASVKQLPYLNGICVIRISTADVHAAAGVVGSMNIPSDPYKPRASFIEFDDLAGTPQAAIDKIGNRGDEWAREVQPFPFAHG
jgi:hypothetical protein